MQERADAYAKVFPQWPASHLHVGQEQGRDVIYGIWVIGNDYRNPTNFYGAYPKGYLDRATALFPDICTTVGTPPKRVLHAFSGSLPRSPDYDRCDLRQESEYQCNIYDLPALAHHEYELVFADPPYSAQDAKEYGTPGVARGRAMGALAQVVVTGGFCAWLDTTWPMHSKTQWLTVGRIFIQRSTNHRVRLLSLFERVE